MNGPASSKLQLKPLAACLAFALCAGTSSTALSVTRPMHVAPNTIAHHAVRRTGEGFLRIQQERLTRGWSQARMVTPRPAATVAVTSCDDDGSSGTLRAVVASAVDGDTVDLSGLTCSTITLSGGGIGINVDNLSVVGPGANALTIDAAGAGTALDFFGAENSGYGTLQVSGLTLANGSEEVSGGAIWAGNGGSVVLTNSVVTNSTSAGKYASGGGIFASGNVTLVNSTVSNNTASSSKYDGLGGGVYAKGDLTVINSTISGNTASADASYDGYYGTADGYGLGGGAAVAGTVRISNSTISGNAAAIGGAMFAMALESLQNSTVTLNAALPENSSTGFGEGGGIAISTVNGAGSAMLNSSILFGNTGGGGYYGADLGGLGSTIGSNNLIGASTSPVPVDTLSADPLLLPLAANGGPTKTHALAAGSPAIDAGSNPDNLTTDQRGGSFARVSGAAADIGAFEVQSIDVIFADGFDSSP